MNQWTIRSAAPVDALALSDVAWAAKSHWGYAVDVLETWRAELSLSEEYVAAHDVFAAELDGAIVGVCAIEDHATHWVLAHLWVRPGSQGVGVGSALFQRAMAAAAAKQPGTVRVVSDPYAAAFYERLGGRRTDALAAPIPGEPQRILPVFEFTTGGSACG